MKSRQHLIALATAVIGGAVTFNACLLNRDGLLNNETGGGGTGTGPEGGGGTSVTCNDPSDCGAPPDCAAWLCVANECVADPLAAGTACQGGGTCDGMGTCRLSNGQTCGDSSQCASTFCVDGFCCATACDAACETCGLLAPSPGTCAPAAAGSDPRMDCGESSCDGAGTCVPGVHIWSKAFGPMGSVSGPLAVAADSSGGIFLGGAATGQLVFPPQSAVGVGTTNGFVAKLDAEGEATWVRELGGTGVASIEAVEVDNKGDVVVCGSLTGTADLGQGAVTAAGSQDLFIARYDGATGSASIVEHYGAGGQTQGCLGIAITSSNDIVFAGKFTGTLDIGTHNVTSNGGPRLAVGKLNEQGVGQWLVGTGGADPTTQTVTGLAVNASDDVWVGGFFNITIDLGGGPLSAGGGGSYDIFLAKLSGVDGSHLFSSSYGNTTSESFSADLACVGDGVVVAGRFGNTLDLGDGAMTANGLSDGFIAMFDGVGQLQWKSEIDASNQVQPNDLSIDANGNTLVIGDYVGQVVVGNAMFTHLSASNSRDVVLFKLSPAGTTLWSRSAGDLSPNQFGRGVASLPDRKVAGVGRFDGQLSFGQQLDGSANDVFLTVLGP